MLSLLLTLSAAAPQDAAAERLSTSIRTLPTLGVELLDERFLDRATNTVVRRTSDRATGVLVDGDALLRAEAAARDRVHGKLSHELRERLAGADKLTVVFWLQRPAGAVDLRAVLDRSLLSGRRAEDARRDALAVAERETSALVAPFVAAAKAERVAVDYVDSHVPLVFATVTVAELRTLAARADVDQVYYSFPAWFDEASPNEFGSGSARTDHVHRRGVTGAGVKVLVNDTANVATTNPNLPPIVTGNTSGIEPHATAVAGIIASRHTPHTGAAPGLAQIYSYGAFGDQTAPMAWAWGMSQGISFGNCSWWNGSRGSIVFLDRYFDYIIRNFAVLLFKSAGNQGNNQPVTTPGNGFNMLASGSADDRNTLDWDDDIIASYSSTSNPQPSNHEKPEITAHGTAITTTTTASPWIGAAGSGTSYASPVTCGAAALLAATDPALQAKPEVVKAALMAGAWNDIHGTAPLSDFDGAGGLDAAAAQDAIARQQYVAATLTSASFNGGLWTTTVPLTAGDETRIVALWFSSADSSYATDVLQMDLDMTVENPSGAVVATSASANNPFEIVAFVPAVSGTYTIKLRNQRFQGTSELLAVAWNTRQNAATDVVTLSGTPAPGATIGFEFFDRYHAGEVYVGVLSATPSTWAIPRGFVLALGFDGLTAASLSGSLPGFIGVLGSTGRANASLTIPPIPSLSGLQLYSGMITLQRDLPEAEVTSPVLGFRIQ